MCEISGCPNPAIAQGLCAKHYMRQRRTGDPTVTRKPGPNGTALRQENTELRQENAALRQKVTVLEQELAQQQRVMAKAAQQEGFAMKATRAAITKPDSGFVGSYDENFEFHEFLSPPPPYPLSILYAPEEARPAIKKIWEETLPDKEVRMALKRLATDGKMRGVWEELRNVKYVADVAEIIPSAIDALEMFQALRPPPQSKQREAWQRYERHWSKLWRHHPHPTGGLPTCATSATNLRYALDSWRTALAPIGDKLWSRYWRGDPAMNSMGAAISFLAALQDCLMAIENEQRSDVNRYLPIRSDARAPQRFFAREMSDVIAWVCGAPRHDILATLVCVAFNLDDGDGVKTGKVREWCREDRYKNS
jgi:hypothetical protein